MKLKPAIVETKGLGQSLGPPIAQAKAQPMEWANIINNLEIHMDSMN